MQMHITLMYHCHSNGIHACIQINHLINLHISISKYSFPKKDKNMCIHHKIFEEYMLKMSATECLPSTNFVLFAVS